MSQSVCDRGIEPVREQIVKTWRLRQDTALENRSVRWSRRDSSVSSPAVMSDIMYSRCPGKYPASLCAAASPVLSSVQRWDWSATQDRRTPVLSESPWRRSTAGHHARRLIVSAAWGSAVGMQPSTWWRRYVASIITHFRSLATCTPSSLKSWRVQRLGWRAVAGPDNRANQQLFRLTAVHYHADISRLLNELVDEQLHLHKIWQAWLRPGWYQACKIL